MRDSPRQPPSLMRKGAWRREDDARPPSRAAELKCARFHQERERGISSPGRCLLVELGTRPARPLSEVDLRAHTYRQTVLPRSNMQRRRQGSAGVEHALEIRLHRPPRSNLVQVGHLNHRLVLSDIVRRAAARGSLGAQAPQRVARTCVRDCEADSIVAAAGDETLPVEAAFEVHVLAIAPIWSRHHQAESR